MLANLRQNVRCNLFLGCKKFQLQINQITNVCIHRHISMRPVIINIVLIWLALDSYNADIHYLANIYLGHQPRYEINQLFKLFMSFIMSPNSCFHLSITDYRKFSGFNMVYLTKYVCYFSHYRRTKKICNSCISSICVKMCTIRFNGNIACLVFLKKFKVLL